MLLTDLVRTIGAGALLGLIVVKLVLARPHYLERLLPNFWLRLAKRMKARDWLNLLAIASLFAIALYFTAGFLSRSIPRELLYSEDGYTFIRLWRLSPIALLATVGILPIFEEWVFRGILLEEAARRWRSRALGLITSAVVFGLFHLSNPGTHPALAIPAIASGVLLGACYLMGGLASATLSHIGYNIMAVASWGLGQ